MEDMEDTEAIPIVITTDKTTILKDTNLVLLLIIFTICNKLFILILI
jgi:hypothetical protein